MSQFYQPYIVAVDFDHTIADEAEDGTKTLLPHAKEVIAWIFERGCYIIIWTCRSGEKLESAKKFLKDQGIKFHLINDNISILDFPTSRKILYDVLIDDKNIGTEKVDWMKVKEQIKEDLIKRYADEIMHLKTAQPTFTKIWDVPPRMRKQWGVDQLDIFVDPDEEEIINDEIQRQQKKDINILYN